MLWRLARTVILGGCVAAGTAACSRYNLDDVPSPDPDLAAPAPPSASPSRGLQDLADQGGAFVDEAGVDLEQSWREIFVMHL